MSDISFVAAEQEAALQVLEIFISTRLYSVMYECHAILCELF